MQKELKERERERERWGDFVEKRKEGSMWGEDLNEKTGKNSEKEISWERARKKKRGKKREKRVGWILWKKKEKRMKQGMEKKKMLGEYLDIYMSRVRKIDWLVWFYGISTFVGYLTPNPYLWK